MLKMFSRDPRVQLASLQPQKTIGLGVGALGSQPLRSIAMFTLCRIHAPFSLRERRRRFISFGYTLPYLVNPLSPLQALLTYRSGCGEASKLVATLADYRVPRVQKLLFCRICSRVVRLQKQSYLSNYSEYPLQMCYRGSQGIVFS